MELRDLNKLANQSKHNYSHYFNSKDFKLPRDFKDLFSEVLNSNDATIHYNDYTAEIIRNSGNKIFFPNQWFYIATFVVDYVKELIKYKKCLEDVCEAYFSNSKAFWNEIKDLKGSEIEDITPNLNKAIEEHFINEQQNKDYLITFITDYSWWYGQKTIDRTDYYVSPCLNLLELVNVSQSYVSQIVSYMAENEQLFTMGLELQEQRADEASNIVDNSNHVAENIIVYGAPGTGKSNYLEKNFFNGTRVVFHSEYSYYDFVGSYKPVPVYKRGETLYGVDGEEFSLGEPRINYQYVPGPFINVLIEAIENPTEQFTLLIEEINRANAPSVFGDIFQLMDRNKDGRSEYVIIPNVELAKYLSSLGGTVQHLSKGLYIPNNMNIVATMNSADQGVFVLDSAFKRRWKYKYMEIKESGFVHEDILVKYAGATFKWRMLLASINNKLKQLEINEDRLIGPYFISPDEIEDNKNVAAKLLIYLWDDVVRYKHNDFFVDGIRTYSELVNAYYNEVDIMEIVDDLNKMISKESILEEEEMELEEIQELDEE
ncbi:AAA family ATPase [Alkalihalobacillus trypoxylicola]|uniref:ATPase dynein-related AAA domain-containing protein n=1 Tax=Alkalihalobacillus trypoxylicola TaxID=519424 RepID=A0A162D1I6_9BACI|nr:AAA family ATPase [Alkalihalobacillus trypoxylicola]KYG27721.1 hypothetical protein AZF04_11065 [Alkalihalobacillus trypoxylicola]